MLHSTLALSLLLIAVTSNLAMAIKKEKRAPQTLSRGWGDEITWVQTYEEGLYQAKKSNKPLMVIHHLEDCQYCQALKKAFAENEEIQEMAQNNFIMLNLMHETTDKNLSPDGQYVPRIMFVGILQEQLFGTERNGLVINAAIDEIRNRAAKAMPHYHPQLLWEWKAVFNPNTFSDPSLTVRADITGRYSNRLYTYEPQDMMFLIENMKKALRLIQTEL